MKILEKIKTQEIFLSNKYGFPISGNFYRDMMVLEMALVLVLLLVVAIVLKMGLIILLVVMLETALVLLLLLVILLVIMVFLISLLNFERKVVFNLVSNVWALFTLDATELGIVIFFIKNMNKMYNSTCFHALSNSGCL